MGAAWAIVVAAGSGSRFGGAKQYEPLGGRRVLDWAVATARAACDGVVLVVPPPRSSAPEPSVDVVVPGGDTRSSSVRLGLSGVPASGTEIVVVHDAARPLASAALFSSVMAAVAAGADGAVPAVAVTDTIRRRDGAHVDRDDLVAVQTPQAFRYDVLCRAHEGATDATDDSALVEAIGGTVVLVEGEPENRKITTPADLLMAAALLP